ncbi:MAG: PrsW family intramembrane metalloprotease [Clostridiales bacterium]|nr:PrsW family intramembrane metalloprotease [Clostridiales bacterium]
MLFVLALIPVIGLLLFIYFNDKKEKEPFGFLIALFFLGMATVVTAIIGEFAGGAILNVIFSEKSVLKQIIDAIFVVAVCEEIGKFLVLWLFTWKNKNFNYSYDAIVYAVFVSLGFACLENVVYVFSNGVGTAIARMLTAVPGHACFAVFMGFFYSKAKYASLTKKKSASARNILLAMIVPILVHGVYDAILMAGRVMEDDVTVLAVLLWIGLVIAMFVVCFILVFKSSRNDFCIITLPEQVQTVYRPSIVGNWTCTCGSINRMNFCPKCGKQRTFVTTWYCPKCGSPSSLNFCGNCGCPKPAYQPQAQNPVC